MKKALLVSMLAWLGVAGTAIAQVDTAWVRRYDSPTHGGDAGYDICTDSVGNVYVTGAPVTIKYSPSGVALWTKVNQGPGGIGFVGNKVAVDRSGNVFVAGYCGTNPNYYFGLIKYSPQGDTLWARSYTTGQGQAFDVEADSAGNAYVTGMGDNLSGGNFLTVKYSPSGDTLWVRRYDGPD